MMVDPVPAQIDALNRRVQQRLKALGWSQNALERRLEELTGRSHRGVVSQLKGRSRMPNSSLAMALAQALGVDVRWLLHGIGHAVDAQPADAAPLLAELDRVATSWPDHVRAAVRALALGNPSAYTLEDLERVAAVILAMSPKP